jgi:hypothetical protein
VEVQIEDQNQSDDEVLLSCFGAPAAARPHNKTEGAKIQMAKILRRAQLQLLVAEQM